MSNGVIHVGAHLGEEIPQYIADGRSPIICFEPLIVNQIPEGVDWYDCALGSETGKFTMHIPKHHHSDGMDTQSSSMLPLLPDRAAYIGWSVTPTRDILIECMRFDEWAELAEFNRDCALLVIDVQGMELQTLKGFGTYLNDFTEIMVEVSSPPVYHGGADAREVESFLGEHGFVSSDLIPNHGDMYFVRNK